jgi:hypothetical protein
MTTDGRELPMSRLANPDLPFQKAMKLFIKRLGRSLFMALIACVSLSIAYYCVRKELRYGDQGVSTTAQVIQRELHLSGGKHQSWVYTLKYRYRDFAGRVFEGQGDVPQSVWDQSDKGNEGNDVAIEYLRDEPSESRPQHSPFRRWTDIVGGMCCCGGWGLGCLIAAIMMFCKPARK